MWTVEPITKKQADYIVTRRHYSRRGAMFWKAFALVDRQGLIEGVAVYGQPSPTINTHAFTGREFRLYELSRLVVQSTKANAASFLVGRSLRLLERPSAVVSYADSEWGHAGIVYQATNWLYTGATKAHHKSYVVDGKRVQSMSLYEKGITAPEKWARENGIEVVPPEVKHRYFYLNGRAFQKKAMREQLRYPVVSSYPKTDKKMYDAGPHVLLSVHDTEADMFGGLC
jgi:hypothetical protein